MFLSEFVTLIHIRPLALAGNCHQNVLRNLWTLVHEDLSLFLSSLNVNFYPRLTWRFWKVLKRKKYFLLLQALESTCVGRIRIGVDKILESVPDFWICTILILIRITNCSGTDIALVRTKSGTLYVIPKSFWNPWLVPDSANKTRFDEMVLVH